MLAKHALSLIVDALRDAFARPVGRAPSIFGFFNVRIRMMFDGLSLICWRMRRSYSSSWYLRYAAAAASAMVAATIG